MKLPAANSMQVRMIGVILTGVVLLASIAWWNSARAVEPGDRSIVVLAHQGEAAPGIAMDEAQDTTGLLVTETVSQFHDAIDETTLVVVFNRDDAEGIGHDRLRSRYLDGIVVMGVNVPRGDLAGILGGGLSEPPSGAGPPYPEPYFSSQRTGCEPPNTRTNCSAGSLSAPISGLDGFMQVVWHLSTQSTRS